MSFYTKEDICPVCKSEARVSRKWVVNKYGKRYDYFVYSHQGYVHYYNQRQESSKAFKKGELEKILIETINSQNFKLGSFQIVDIKKLLLKDYPKISFGSVKVSLNKLTEIGILEKQRKGRNLFYINTVSKDRLSYIINSLGVFLDDSNNDRKYGTHRFYYNIRNDHSWPLYYIPFRVVGDVDITYDILGIKAIDSSYSKDIKIMLIEDVPKDKRVLLRLPIPLLPNEVRNIKIEYYWPEPKQIFVYSSATKMSSFEFSISGNHLLKLSAFLTSASSNETADLSGSVIESNTPVGKKIMTIKLQEVEAFSVLQLKWK
jgi:hypothetical protein